MSYNNKDTDDNNINDTYNNRNGDNNGEEGDIYEAILITHII